MEATLGWTKVEVSDEDRAILFNAPDALSSGADRLDWAGCCKVQTFLTEHPIDSLGLLLFFQFNSIQFNSKTVATFVLLPQHLDAGIQTSPGQQI